jgi:hypothetical protein
MPKLKPGTIVPTDEENKEIIPHAIEDGTLFTDEQLAQMKPISEFPTLQKLILDRCSFKTTIDCLL